MTLCDTLKNKWCGDPMSRKQTQAQINKRGCGPVNKNSCTGYRYVNSNENKKAKENAAKKAQRNAKRANLEARREELRRRNAEMKKKRANSSPK